VKNSSLPHPLIMHMQKTTGQPEWPTPYTAFGQYLRWNHRHTPWFQQLKSLNTSVTSTRICIYTQGVTTSNICYSNIDFEHNCNKSALELWCQTLLTFDLYSFYMCVPHTT
jgi:hypothetical protein